ncbi:MAG: hypothetical protein CM15mP84_02370 [Cellvibrionales bacterium]|nr:MAG: hypothetical protein CM15mP84_02370 [Cellvibrionales bacterium]
MITSGFNSRWGVIAPEYDAELDELAASARMPAATSLELEQRERDSTGLSTLKWGITGCMATTSRSVAPVR